MISVAHVGSWDPIYWRFDRWHTIFGILSRRWCDLFWSVKKVLDEKSNSLKSGGLGNVHRINRNLFRSSVSLAFALVLRLSVWLQFQMIRSCLIGRKRGWHFLGISELWQNLITESWTLPEIWSVRLHDTYLHVNSWFHVARLSDCEMVWSFQWPRPAHEAVWLTGKTANYSLVWDFSAS